MAVAPVFIASAQALQDQLRLGTLIARDAAFDIFEQAMRQARIVLYDSLTSGTVTAILGYTSVENPATSEELVRTKAEGLERDLVMVYLSHHLPVAFMDAAGGMPTWFNKEAPFRLQSPDERAALREELEIRINKALQDITLRFSGVQGSCDVTTGSAPCAHNLGALPDDIQAPLLGASLDKRLLGVNRADWYGWPALL